MPYTISDAAANATLDAFLSTFQTGGVIEIRNGVRPATADTAATGVVLATIPLGISAFEVAGTTTARVAGLVAAINDPLGDAAGSATWFRMYDNATPASAIRILDGDVGALASGADMELDDGAGGTAINTVDKVTISTLTVTL